MKKRASMRRFRIFPFKNTYVFYNFMPLFDALFFHPPPYFGTWKFSAPSIYSNKYLTKIIINSPQVYHTNSYGRSGLTNNNSSFDRVTRVTVYV